MTRNVVLPRHLLGAAAGLLLLAAPAGVQAREIANCTIRSIHGLTQPGGIDKRLALLRKQFSKPPFSAFKTLKLLDKAELQVPKNDTKKTKLPTGKILRLTYKEKLLERKDQIRLRIHLSITPPKKKERFLPGTVYTIANGGTILVGGESYKEGTLVVGITCKAK
jgi:hypothetical protein